MTSIVIATRSGVVSAPDGTKHRLVRGRTLADARHPIVVEFPELFAPHAIDLPHEADELERGEASTEMLGELVDARSAAEQYREQLAAVVEVLRGHDALPDDEAMTEPGWLAQAVAAALSPVAPPPAPRGRPRKAVAQ